jgi:hypothetical protein
MGEVHVQADAEVRTLLKLGHGVIEGGAVGDQAGRRHYSAAMSRADGAIDSARHPQIVGIDEELSWGLRHSVRRRR